jgi:hypothetical protein
MNLIITKFATHRCHHSSKRTLPLRYRYRNNYMDDSSYDGDNGDVPLEITVTDNDTHEGESTATSSIRNEASSSSASFSTNKPLPDKKALANPLPSMQKSRWESSPRTECKHAQASPRLPRRNRTQPLECPKDLFQIHSKTHARGGSRNNDNTWNVLSTLEGHMDDRIQQLRAAGGEARRPTLVRSKSDGETQRRRSKLSTVASRSVHLP